MQSKALSSWNGDCEPWARVERGKRTKGIPLVSEPRRRGRNQGPPSLQDLLILKAWHQGIGFHCTQHYPRRPLANNFAIYLPTAGASSTLSGKELICIISIAGKHSDVPQVAPRMTREGPYLYCPPFLHIFFLSPV